MPQNKIIIAIDGFSSSGKSTMARDLARRIGYVYIDSGAMYRAVTLFALRNGLADADGTLRRDALIEALPNIRIDFRVDGQSKKSHTFLNGADVEKDIRGMEVSALVSPVAEIPEVRRLLVKLQQQYGKEKGIVMDGRDIGTTVFPQAEMKVFVNASPEVRARRRMLELRQKGQNVSYDEVLDNINTRDRIDTTREESPLRKAADAVMLDNDNLSIEEQMDFLLDLFRRKTSR